MRDDFEDQVVKGSMSTEKLPEGAVTDNDVDLEAMFDEAFQCKPDSDFLSGIYEWYQEKDFLTESQYAALCKIVGRNEV